MKTKTIQILGVAAALALVGGVVAERLGDRSTTSDRAGEPALPTLQDSVNDVASVTVEAGGDTLTFERSNGGWATAQKGGYPAKPEKVRSLVLALRELEVVEEKTADASRFGRLGLVDPAEDGASSKRIVLRGESGDEVASLLVGDRRSSRGGAGAMGRGGQGTEMHYVFAGEEGDPALLVSGKIVADTRVANWLDTTLMNIAQGRFGAARFTWPDGDVTLIVPGEEEGELRLEGVPEGKESRGAAALDPARNALAGLRFEDVAPEGEIDFGHPSRATTEVFTEHGLKVGVETVELPDPDDADTTRVWARFEAAYAPDGSPAPVPEPAEAEADGAGDDAEPAGATAPEGEDGSPSPEDLQGEAAELNARLSGWAYALPSWKTAALRMRTEELVQDAPPPLTPIEEPAGAVPDGDGAGAADPAAGGAGEAPEEAPGAAGAPPSEDPPSEAPPSEERGAGTGGGGGE